MRERESVCVCVKKEREGELVREGERESVNFSLEPKKIFSLKESQFRC